MIGNKPAVVIKLKQKYPEHLNYYKQLWEQTDPYDPECRQVLDYIKQAYIFDAEFRRYVDSLDIPVFG